MIEALSMKILIPIRRVMDTDYKIRIDKNGAVNREGIPQILNPFDAVAIEEGLLIKEKMGGDVEVVLATVGIEDHEDTLLTGLAMGADRATLIECDEEPESFALAAIIKEVADTESPDLIFTGERIPEDDSDCMGQYLAAFLQWPSAASASRVELRDSAALVDRETDYGIESIEVPLPSVVTCALRLNEPRYASLRGQMSARSKPLQRLKLDDLGTNIENHIEIIDLENVTSHRQCTFVDSPEELLEKLRFEAKVLG